jgi:hypothetical protein
VCVFRGERRDQWMGPPPRARVLSMHEDHDEPTPFLLTETHAHIHTHVHKYTQLLPPPPFSPKHKPIQSLTLDVRNEEGAGLLLHLIALGGPARARFLHVRDLKLVQHLFDEAAEGAGLVPPVDEGLLDLRARGLLWLCVWWW